MWFLLASFESALRWIWLRWKRSKELIAYTFPLCQPMIFELHLYPSLEIFFSREVFYSATRTEAFDHICTPFFGYCTLHVVFKVWEGLRFILLKNYSPSFSSQFLTEYWHWTVMEVLARFSMVIVSSKPIMLYAMSNSCLSPCITLHLFRGHLICHWIALSLSLVRFFWNSKLSVLALTIPNKFGQERFSPTLIPFPKSFLNVEQHRPQKRSLQKSSSNVSWLQELDIYS